MILIKGRKWSPSEVLQVDERERSDQARERESVVKRAIKRGLPGGVTKKKKKKKKKPKRDETIQREGGQ